ncbi:hypothetical protein PO124_31190 [Bacillus licheniformis]|nr:hypothetical protein [Bacillus licheniformis]
MNQLNILESGRQTADRDPDARYSFNGSIIAVIADKFKNMGYSFATLDESMTPVHE